MRTAFASILVVAAIAAALLGWFGAGWSQVEQREHELREAPRREAEAAARDLAAEVVSKLESLRVEEARRPYYHYQSLYHDPRSAAEGLAVQPSPLATGPQSPLVRGHFQVRAKGDDWLADRIYSGIPAAMVGRRQAVVIGPMSGQANVNYWLQEHGIAATPELVQAIFQAAKQANATLGEEEILAFCRAHATRA